jgi:hypothetical protein
MPLANRNRWPPGPLAPWRPPWLAGYGGYPNQFYAWRLSEGRPKAQKTVVLFDVHIIWLVVWNIWNIFPYVGNNHPIWLIFFRGVGQPPTSHRFPPVCKCCCSCRPIFRSVKVFFEEITDVLHEPPPFCFLQIVRSDFRSLRSQQMWDEMNPNFHI